MSIFNKIGEMMGLSGSNNLPYQQQQADLINKLQARASGQTPSLADAVSSYNMSKALGQQMAAINSDQGMNAAQRSMLANQAGQQAQTDIAQQAMMGRLQEQQGAEEALGNAMNTQQNLANNQYQAQMNRRQAFFSNLSSSAAKAASGGVK